MKKYVSKITTVLLIAVLSIAIFSGCQKKGSVTPEEISKGLFPVTVSDVYGSKVTIEKKPERIVALAPSIVEVLYRLELGDKIVGVTDYSDYPAEAKTKPIVGSFNGVNIEKIVELKPDLVLAGAGMSKQDYQKLVDLKINVLVAEAKTLEQIPETFTIIGKATGEIDKSKILVDELQGKIDKVREKVKNAKKVKTYYVISFGKEGNWTAGKGTFLSELINIAGGENIADDVDGWKEYSIEKIVEKNPDVLLISALVANNKDILDNEKGYKETAAVKNDSVTILDDNLTQRPGPRIAEGLEIIARTIHPEIFGK